jgi:hypothetical protein
MRSELLALAVVAACGGGESPLPLAACTPDEQEVDGAPIAIERVDLFEDISCEGVLITSDAELDQHFNGSIPSSIPPIDFAVDRLLLALSNPGVQFAVDDGSAIVVGQESFCQGVAPNCVAHVLRGTTQDTLSVITCPYRGPDPCDAP